MTPLRRYLVLTFVPIFAAACATQPVTDIQPGERPPLESDEAGFWMVMDQVEDGLRTSGRIVHDRQLNGYLREILCALAQEYCADIRLYVVRAPNFNASMGPNGAMQIWTGMLLRAQNEAQLAFVLGHELTHFQRRHTLQRWRDARAKTDAMVFFQLATGLVGLGIIGTMAQLATLGSIFAFSRDQEREADRQGFEMMVRAGYDPDEAAKIWGMLIEERDASEDPDRSVFFSTHPAAKEREKTLDELAQEFDSEATKIGVERFAAVTARFRSLWLRDELRRREFGPIQVLLDHQKEAGLDPGELHYFQGELHRLRGDDKEEDTAKAEAAYRQAIATGAAPPEAHRALGLILWSGGRKDEAKDAFGAYLNATPNAVDRAMIEHYLQQDQ